jgi:hypothetical protein
MKLWTGFACAAALLAAAAPDAALAAPAQAAASAASYLDGLTAYNGNRVAEAEHIYAAVLADGSASIKDRSAAARELARIAWLIDRDADRAVSRADTALAIGDRPCISAALQLRILREAGQSARAVAEAGRFVALCPADPDDADKVREQAYRAGLDLAASQSGAERSATLEAVTAQLSQLSESGKAGLPANQATLALGLLRADAAQALAGWRGYFWLSGDKDAPQGLPSWAGRVAAAFEAGLKPGASAHDQAMLAELLMRTGFNAEARRLSADADLSRRAAVDPAWKRVAAYFHFRDQLDTYTLALNRSLARGGPKEAGPYLNEVQRLVAEAAQALGVPATLESMTEQFGLYGTVGETGGYPSMHAGHVVQDDKRSVDQYGRHGEIRFIAIDNMVANGFESWLWDGRAAAGGWAADGVVAQVRPGYASGPLGAWSLVQDTPARRRAVADLPDLERRDREIIARQPVAYLPGLSHRLETQANAQILARARTLAGGGGEADLRRAFLQEDKRAVDQHSIFIHEGRHTLDHLADKTLTSTQLEYRAKLSELALADYPRLPLSAIDSDTIGTDTPHGNANSEIMKAFGAWVTAHAGEVAGYDPAVPALLQLDKLTDEQIRAIARSLDPWAQASATGR